MTFGAVSADHAGTAGHFIVHFHRGRSWASLLVEAFAQRRIDCELMWEILLAHADEIAAEPDIANLLEHIAERGHDERRQASSARGLPARRDSGDDWFVMAEDDATCA